MFAVWNTVPMERATAASGAWLGAGAAAGAVITLGLVLAVMLLRSDDAAAMGPPQFVEEAEVAGITHVYDGGFPFFVGGGVAVFDCNDDGMPDLYLAGGSNPAALYRNDSTIAGSLRFAPVPGTNTDLTGVTGAYPIDIDADGTVDLAVLRVGENVVLRGTGDCGFARANDLWGIDGGDAWTAAFSATWEGSAALPTLAFGNYVALDETDQQTGSCSDHSLVRPSGPSAYAAPVALTPGWCTLSILFSDWDRSGRRDLRITNDRHYYRDGQDQLWRIVDGEPARLYSQDDGWQPMQIWGMGIASHDLTGDGLPEVFLTSQGDNKLQTLADGPSQPTYRDIALQAGATATHPFIGDTGLPSTAWHPEFQDVNNDGFIDLFIAKGNVEAMPEYAADDPNNLLLGDAGGGFTEAAGAAGIADLGRSRGAALADFNLDGMLDLVAVNRAENVKLWRNVGSGDAGAPASLGNWIAIRLDQKGPNGHAVGSWIEVRAGDLIVRREATIGGGHAGGQLGWVHFGLGTADAAEVRVQWPDGERGPWLPIEANRFATIERGSAEPTYWRLP